MLKFIVMLPFRILFLPVLLFLKITFWICTGLLCMAEWIFEHEFYGKMLCSNCKKEALVNECNEYVDSDFCPHCGAKMRKEDEGK